MSVAVNKPRILIADDSGTIRSQVRKVLHELPVGEILEAENGLDAINSLVANPVDLVISDLQMPKMGGIQLVESIRNNAKLNAIPVLMISGTANAQAVLALAKLKVTNLIAKPINSEVLKNEISKILFQSDK